MPPPPCCSCAGHWRASPLDVAHGLDARDCANASSARCTLTDHDLRGPKYSCPTGNALAEKHEWVPSTCAPLVKSDLARAFENRVVCFWGDSLANQMKQIQTMLMKILAKT